MMWFSQKPCVVLCCVVLGSAPCWTDIRSVLCCFIHTGSSDISSNSFWPEVALKLSTRCQCVWGRAWRSVICSVNTMFRSAFTQVQILLLYFTTSIYCIYIIYLLHYVSKRIIILFLYQCLNVTTSNFCPLLYYRYCIFSLPVVEST